MASDTDVQQLRVRYLTLNSVIKGCLFQASKGLKPLWSVVSMHEMTETLKLDSDRIP